MDYFISIGVYHPMNALINKPVNVHILWIAMLLLTMTTYAMGKLGFSGAVVMLFLLLTATAKATFIIRDFMELRGVSLLWRVIMYGWLLVVIISIAITYTIYHERYTLLSKPE
jgi:ABC-type transport system involved in cytochrome c biogenesis permease subunit